VFVFPLLPLPRGHYDARVEDSWIASWDSYLGRKPKRYRALCAAVELFKNGKLVCGMILSVCLFGRRSRPEWQALQSLASALGAEMGELLMNGEALKGKSFKLLVWGWNRRFSYRPAPNAA
jgi:hypothetical protein